MSFAALGEAAPVCEVEVLSEHHARPGAQLLDSLYVHVGGEPRRQRGEPPEPSQLPQLRLHLPCVFLPSHAEATRIPQTPAPLGEIRLLRPGKTLSLSPA